MSQLDKTFPTLDCSQCILTPKMVDVGRAANIELMTYSEVDAVEGYIGNFDVTIRKKARGVLSPAEAEARGIVGGGCNGCGDCEAPCPVIKPNRVRSGHEAHGRRSTSATRRLFRFSTLSISIPA